METGIHMEKEGKMLPSKLVNELSLFLECSICKEMMSDAVVLKKCGHSFCFQCIKAAFKLKKQCPIDRLEIGENFKEAIIPNFSIRQQIDALLIYCPFGLAKDRTSGEWKIIDNGCKLTIPLSDKQAHVAICSFAIIRCPYKDDLGNFCGFVCKRSELQNHLDNCDYVPVKCKNEGCRKMICKKFLDHHSNFCKMKTVECERGCGALILKMKTKEHECDFEKCPFFEYGCKFRSKNSDMEKHLQEMVAAHLSFTMLQTKQIVSKELIVHPAIGEGYPNIQAAIDAASYGDHILVFPGIYDEKVTLYKSVHIKGIGECEKILLSPSKGTVISSSCDGGSISNISIVKSDKDKHFAVNISGGSVVIQYCDISSKSLGCVKIKKGFPKLLHNNIHSSAMGGGVFVLGDASPWIEGKGNGKLKIPGNRIHDNELTGIEVKEGGAPSILQNSIYHHNESGIFIHSLAMGVIEENQIFGNTNGIKLKDCSPVITRNTIRDCSEYGICILGPCNGKIKDNHIYGCKKEQFIDPFASGSITVGSVN